MVFAVGDAGVIVVVCSQPWEVRGFEWDCWCYLVQWSQVQLLQVQHLCLEVGHSVAAAEWRPLSQQQSASFEVLPAVAAALPLECREQTKCLQMMQPLLLPLQRRRQLPGELGV